MRIAILTTTLLTLATTASAQTPEMLARARAAVAHEPEVAEVSEEALRHFRVDPGSFDRLRTTARTRGLLPLFAAGYRYDDDAFARTETQRLGSNVDINESNAAVTHSVNVGALWDLRQLAFNPSEVQVYGLVGVQRDLLLEVTRTFFLRRQLQMRLALRPPDDLLARTALELRIQEFTAVLDVLTGRWFSQESRRRRQQPRGGREG